ncbi:MAG TPA: hypothetical protein PK280_07360 [Planctomycetota bacterium]|nr:hypothetical protein [Planctomycetota bacterium]
MPFRKCPQCDCRWPGREAFLADPAVALSGCQVDTDNPRGSALVFDHKVAGCGTTIAIPVRHFADLYSGPVHKVNWAPSAKCPRKCFDPKNLDSCPAQCASAFVREILQSVLRITATKRP